MNETGLQIEDLPHLRELSVCVLEEEMVFRRPRPLLINDLKNSQAIPF